MHVKRGQGIINFFDFLMEVSPPLLWAPYPESLQEQGCCDQKDLEVLEVPQSCLLLDACLWDAPSSPLPHTHTCTHPPPSHALAFKARCLSLGAGARPY